MIVLYLFQRKKVYLIPWLLWSVMYILIAVSCCIYELSLGGRIIELIVPPILYVTIIGSWIYVVLCVYAYFLSMPYESRSEAEQTDYELNAEQSKLLVLTLREGISDKIYPRTIWEDNSSVSNFSDGRRLSLRSLSMRKEPLSPIPMSQYDTQSPFPITHYETQSPISSTRV